MATVSSIAEHIVITPGTCGGKPRIAGQRITVQNLVICHEKLGMTPEQIVGDFQTITLADVYAALAYYHDHQEEIIESIRREEEVVAEMEVNQPSLLTRIKDHHPEKFRQAMERFRAGAADDLP